MRNVGTALASALIALTCAAARAEVKCPDHLSVEQRAQPPEGWTASYRSTTLGLATVDIFDGQPANRVRMGYAARKRVGHELILRWRLPESLRSYYLQCAYEHTTALISMPLPPGVHECEIAFDTRSSLPGGRMPVTRMVCR